jgi:hypothetical protein
MPIHKDKQTLSSDRVLYKDYDKKGSVKKFAVVSLNGR